MKKILLVDDDLNFRSVMKYQLSRMGFEVEVVSDGLSAIQRCRETSYSLVVADVNIPVMRGLSFLPLIKQCKPAVPIIVISAFFSMDHVASARLYGADDVLEKPCDEAILRERIEAWAS